MWSHLARASLFALASCLATSGVQSCMPGASVIVRSSAIILNWRYQPCHWQWPSPSQISSRRTMCTVTRVSLLLVRVWKEVCHHTYDETLATDYSSENWKHFCSGVTWPRPIHCDCLLFRMRFRNILTYLIWRNRLVTHFVKAETKHTSILKSEVHWRAPSGEVIDIVT